MAEYLIELHTPQGEDTGSVPGQSVWGLWCIKWKLDMFFSRAFRSSPVTLTPPAPHTHIWFTHHRHYITWKTERVIVFAIFLQVSQFKENGLHVSNDNLDIRTDIGMPTSNLQGKAPHCDWSFIIFSSYVQIIFSNAKRTVWFKCFGAVRGNRPISQTLSVSYWQWVTMNMKAVPLNRVSQ